MRIRLVEHEVYFPRPSLSELNILHLSDLHLAGENRKIEQSFKSGLYKKEFDFIFLTGDLVDSDNVIGLLINYSSLLKSLKLK